MGFMVIHFLTFPFTAFDNFQGWQLVSHIPFEIVFHSGAQDGLELIIPQLL